MQCLNPDCNQFNLSFGNYWIRFIKESNNENLKKKYRTQILTNEYFILPFFPGEYGNYIGLIGDLFDFIGNKCCRCCEECCTKFENCIGRLFLEILGVFLASLIFIIYITVFCIFPHFAIKKLYYFKFIKEISERNNKILLILIILGEEIIFLILIFPLMIIHYIYTILFFPILFLICFIRNKIYDIGN